MEQSRAEYNVYVICNKHRVVRWLDCPCEIIWKLHFSSLSKQFLYVFFSFCLLSSSFLFPHLSFFSYLVAPLSVLSFQEAKMFRSSCPYKIFKPLFLTHLNPSCRLFLRISFKGIFSYFPKLRIESVHFCECGSVQCSRFTAIGDYLKIASFGNFCMA